MIADDNRILNYRGLEYLIEKLKSFFIKSPGYGSEGQYLRMTANGSTEWADFPSFLVYKGPVETYAALSNIENPSVGDVYLVTDTGAEYYWTGTAWEYAGEIIHIPLYTAGDNIDITNHVVSAEGYVLTDGTNSFAEGYKGDINRGKATGSYSHAEGYLTSASAIEAHAEGAHTIAGAKASHAEGLYTIAKGTNSHAEGSNTTALVKNTHAEGKGSRETIGVVETFSLDKKSFVLSVFGGSISNFVVGSFIECAGTYAKIESIDVSTNTVTVNLEIADIEVDSEIFSVKGASCGESSHSEGENTQSLGKASHTEGQNTIAMGVNSHAEGDTTKAVGASSHAEGNASNAVGSKAHAEGDATMAIGVGAHAEGSGSSTEIGTIGTITQDKLSFTILPYSGSPSAFIPKTIIKCEDSFSRIETVNSGTRTVTLSDPLTNAVVGSKIYEVIGVAYGDFAHAEGNKNTAYGEGSHAEGWGTLTTNPAEHAEGYFNKSREWVENVTPGTVSSIGIGDNYNRKNAFEVVDSGDVYVYGIGGYQGTDIKEDNPSIKTLQESLGDINIIETVKVNGTALTPDANKAVDVTDIHQSIATSNNKMYLTGVEDSSGIPTGAQTGVANTGVYATNGDFHLDGNIEHNVDLFNSGTPVSQDSLIRSINIDCTSKKYVYVKTNYEGNFDIHINLPDSGVTLNGVREVICRISNVAQSDQSLKQLTVRVNAISAETGYTHVTHLHNMYNSSITLSGYGVNINNAEVMELVFTFWDENDVTFNGGISV